MRRVQSFVPMDSGLKVQRLKRAGQDVSEKPVKRQKIGEASGSGEEHSTEKEKVLSQEDLQQMMMIQEDIGELSDSTDPTDDKERTLWVKLKRLFELDTDDIMWKLQRYMHDLLTWRLYDTCGVHHVSIDRGHDIFMLVKKDYPLTRGLLTLMLCNKLQVDQYSEMADELLRKIIILANRPRHTVKRRLSTAKLRNRLMKKGITMAEPNLNDYISLTRKNFLSDDNKGKMAEKSFLKIQVTFLVKIRDNTFNGSIGENAVEHIENFLDVVRPLKIKGVSHDRFSLSVFPISLAGAPSERFKKDCIGSVTTWEDLVEKFVQKFYQLSYNNEEMEADEDDNPDDIAEIFKNEGNLFDFETPLCKLI
ncbi:hypothetical protein Tco_0339229 [Tanacetum coccineum]